MKYLLLLILLTACNESRQDFIDYQTKTLDSMNKQLIELKGSLMQTNESKKDLLKLTFSAGYHQGVNQFLINPKQIDITFLKDSIRFANIVDRTFE